jgi:L-ascorbate metabolism protein UlaG (beta-lactamase superfamily)
MMHYVVKTIVIVCLCLNLCLISSACTKKDAVNTDATNNQQVQASPWGGINYCGAAVGYVIKFENGTKIYSAGDTGLFYDMKKVIGEIYQPDVAFLPIGNVFTMNEMLAAKATEWVNPKIVVPVHFATFPVLTKTPDKFLSLVKEAKDKGDTRADVKSLTIGKKENILGIDTMWYGHSTLMYKSVSGKNIYVDPTFFNNLTCPEQYKDINNIEKPDIILLTHGHMDHMNVAELKKICEKYDPVIICSFELGIYLQQQGIKSPIVLVNSGGTINKDNIAGEGSITDGREALPEGLEISVVHAEHSSSN